MSAEFQGQQRSERSAKLLLASLISTQFTVLKVQVSKAFWCTISLVVLDSIPLGKIHKIKLLILPKVMLLKLAWKLHKFFNRSYIQQNLFLLCKLSSTQQCCFVPCSNPYSTQCTGCFKFESDYCCNKLHNLPFTILSLFSHFSNLHLELKLE